MEDTALKIFPGYLNSNKNNEQQQRVSTKVKKESNSEFNKKQKANTLAVFSKINPKVSTKLVDFENGPVAERELTDVLSTI